MKNASKTRFVKVILLSVGCLSLVYELSNLDARLSTAFMDDFIAYWAAGRLQGAGKNPYSFQLFSELQKSIGWQERPHVMLYPPWAFSLLLPLGIAEYARSRLVWLLLNAVLLVFSAAKLWDIYRGPRSRVQLAWGIAFVFYPSLYLLRIGQMGLVTLLGVILFLSLLEREKDWQAGAVLALAAVKPHLAYLFWLALGLWLLQERRWKVLGGAALALVVGSAIPMLFNPHLIEQASAIWGQAQTPLFEYDTPTLGTILRKLFGWEKHWLQFLPMVLCSAGLFWHWRRRRHAWNWSQEAPLLLAVSVWTCLYSWVSDLILMLPAVMQLSVLMLNSPQPQRWRGAFLFVGLNVLCLVLNLRGGTDFAFAWLVPALLVSYGVLQPVALKATADAA